MSSIAASVQVAASPISVTYPPFISDEDLTHLAKKLNVKFAESKEQLLKNCFEAAYEACKHKKWEQIDPERDKMSALTNRLGHSLLLEAFARGDFDTADLLIEKSISLLSVEEVEKGTQRGICPDLRQTSKEKIQEYIKISYEIAEPKKDEQYVLLNLAFAKQANDPIYLGMSYIKLGEILYSLFPSRAIIYLTKGLENLNGECLEYEFKARSLLIGIHAKTDMFEEQIANYEACQHIAKLLSASSKKDHILNSERVAFSLIGCSETYRSIGKHANALDLVTQAIMRLKKMKDSPSKSDLLYSAYMNEGMILLDIKFFETALDSFHAARMIAEKEGQLEMWSSACSNIMRAYNFLEKYKAAVDVSRMVLPVAKRHQFNLVLVSCYQHLGRALACLNQNDRALNSFKKGLMAAERLKSKWELASAHASISAFYLAIEDFSAAENSYRETCSLFFQTQRYCVKQPEWKITMFDKQIRHYQGLEIALAGQTKREEQLLTADCKRARALLQILADKYPTASAKSLEQEGLNLKRMQELAVRQETTFVVYSNTLFSWMKEKVLHAWVIPPVGKCEFAPLSMGLIEADNVNFESMLKKFPFSQSRGFNQTEEIELFLLKELMEPLRGDTEAAEEKISEMIKQKKESRQKEFKKKLRIWHETFIEPIEKLLPTDDNQTVTFVPDGFLAQLPFAAMLDSKDVYLIEKHPISVVPSIQVMQLLEEISLNREKTVEESALIIGNPLLNNSKFKPLKIAKEEAEDVGKKLNAKESFILTEADATVTDFMHKAPKVHWIFASCHGEAACKPEANPHSVFEGQLKFAPDQNYPSGNLHSQLISQLDLQAKLVFLSACYSGTGKLKQEGVIGNAWSFLAAGALSVVSTYWPLPENKTTRKMVNEFFFHVLGKGAEKLNQAQALRKAMLLGMEENRDNISQWGSFYLSGLIQFDKTQDAQIALLEKVKSLGIERRKSGENAQAAPFLEQAFNIGQSLPNFPDEELSLICHLLGNIYRTLQRYEDAQKYLLQARDLREKNPGNVVDRVKTLNSLGLLYSEKRDFKSAEKTFSEALELIRTTDVGSDLSDLIQRNSDRLKKICTD